MFRRTFAILSLAAVALPLSAASLRAAEEGEIDFARQIQPIFAKRCFKCHGPNEDEAGLRLSSREAAIMKLESEEHAIVPGDIKASHILARLRSTDEDEKMPPEGKPVSDEDIALIEKWIASGAKWSAHWSYRKPEQPSVPKPKNQTWVHNPIDAFVLAKLERQGLKPAAPASKVALIRRAYYDLTGLPPTPEEVDDFVNDSSPQAYEKVVDRLLTSPQYGEKWARHWLDLVRYAETNGYERDSRKDEMWRYRDYIISAFNENKPYDRFIIEHIAGDDLPNKTGASITATGFYRLGTWDDEPADRELARYDYLDDILRTTGEAFLGMTIGCARCHDHKIDPVSQKDYYSMLSFFSDVSPHGKGGSNHVAISVPREDGEYKTKLENKRKHEANLRKQITDIESAFRKGLAEKHPEETAKSAPAGAPKGGIVLADSTQVRQEWEYTLSKPADNWFEIAFDDSKWKKGKGGFGTAGTPGAVVGTEWKTSDIWLRKDFQLLSIPNRMTLRIHHDEEAKVYINGKHIVTLLGHATDYTEIDISDKVKDVLQTGRSTLAIHCHQTAGGQFIDAGLKVSKSGTSIFNQIKKFGNEIVGAKKVEHWTRLNRDLKRSETQQIRSRPSKRWPSLNEAETKRGSWVADYPP